ncbi:MAG: hypothetical protein LBB59_06110 [Campylobacteraceae bacterium]|nr:hypothetical protein [Campylobacteraceae bacterium]
MKLKNIENYKIYSLIAISIIAFVILVFESFDYVGSELENLSKQNRNFIIKEMRYLIKSWLKEAVNTLELIAYDINENYENEEQIKKISRSYAQYGKYFDALQILVVDNYFYVNDIKANDYKKHVAYHNDLCNFGEKILNIEFIKECMSNADETAFQSLDDELWYLKRKWFQDTKKSMKTNMETMDIHGLFFEKTINLALR